MDAFTERNGALLHASGQPVSTTVAGDVEYLTHYARLIASAFSRGGGFTFAGIREPGNELFFRIDRSGALLGVSGTGESGWSRMLHESGC